MRFQCPKMHFVPTPLGDLVRSRRQAIARSSSYALVALLMDDLFAFGTDRHDDATLGVGDRRLTTVAFRNNDSAGAKLAELFIHFVRIFLCLLCVEGGAEFLESERGFCHFPVSSVIVEKLKVA